MSELFQAEKTLSQVLRCGANVARRMTVFSVAATVARPGSASIAPMISNIVESLRVMFLILRLQQIQLTGVPEPAARPYDSRRRRGTCLVFIQCDDGESCGSVSWPARLRRDLRAFLSL